MKQITPTKTSEYVAMQLAEEILSGHIRSQAVLHQEALAQQLGTSRIPIREAFSILEHQGLTVRLSTRHIIAAELTPEQLYDIFDLFAVLENQIIAKQPPAITQPSRTIDIHIQLAGHCDNAYFKTMLQGAVKYYLTYACTLSEPNSVCSFMLEALGETNAKERLNKLRQHFKKLADNILNERRK